MRGGIEDRARVIASRVESRAYGRCLSRCVPHLLSETPSRTFTFLARDLKSADRARARPRWVDLGARRSRARRGCRELDASLDEDRRSCSPVSPFGCAASCHGSIAGRTPANLGVDDSSVGIGSERVVPVDVDEPAVPQPQRQRDNTTVITSARGEQASTTLVPENGGGRRGSFVPGRQWRDGLEFDCARTSSVNGRSRGSFRLGAIGNRAIHRLRHSARFATGCLRCTVRLQTGSRVEIMPKGYETAKQST